MHLILLRFCAPPEEAGCPLYQTALFNPALNIFYILEVGTEVIDYVKLVYARLVLLSVVIFWKFLEKRRVVVQRIVVLLELCCGGHRLP